MGIITQEAIYDIIDKETGRSDLDWSEICQKYDLALSPDTVRKAGVGIKWLNDLGMVSTVALSDPIDDGNAKLRTIQMERQKFFDQRREYNKLISKQARRDSLTDRLEQAARDLNITKPLDYVYDGRYIESLDHEAVLFLSDFHYGKETSNIFNSYSTAICRERFRVLLNETIFQCISKRVSRIHVVILGDMIEGCLRASSRIASSELTCDQVMQVSELLAEAMSALAKSIEFVDIYSAWGNHGRMVQKYEDSVYEDNAERIIPWWLSARLADAQNIKIHDDNFFELVNVNCCGDVIVAAHGDLDKDADTVLKLNEIYHREYGRSINKMVVGHLHENKQRDVVGIKTYVCGSLCGTDEYAKDKRLFSVPSQLLMMYRKGYGLEYVSEIDVA